MRVNKPVSKRESVQESNTSWILSGFSLFFHSPSGYKSLTKKIVSHWSHSSPPSQSNLRCWFFRPSRGGGPKLRSRTAPALSNWRLEIADWKMEDRNLKLEIAKSEA